MRTAGNSRDRPEALPQGSTGNGGILYSGTKQAPVRDSEELAAVGYFLALCQAGEPEEESV